MKIGERVGAAREATKDVVYMYGYGTYQGMEIPPDGFCNEVGLKNPKILLDNGKIIWGQECWFGSEKRFNKEFIKDRKVVLVNLD